jgi:hypothetical protein
MFVERIHCIHEKVTAVTNFPVLPSSDIHSARLNSSVNITLILIRIPRSCDYEGFYPVGNSAVFSDVCQCLGETCSWSKQRSQHLTTWFIIS